MSLARPKQAPFISTPSSDAAPAPKPKVELTSLLGAKELDDLALQYVDVAKDVKDVKDAKDSKDAKSVYPSASYSPEKVGSTFFENRLPVITLLLHAVRGEKDQVYAMINKNPLLLLEKDTVTDYSGRTHYKRTVYQLLLGAVDCDVKDKNGKTVVDGSIEMVQKLFEKLPFKPEEINRIRQEQYDDQYPQDDKIIEKIRIQNDSTALNTLINTITVASDDDCKATNTLEDKIHSIVRSEKKSPEEIEAPETIELRKIVQSVMKSASDEKFETAFDELKKYLNKYSLIKQDESKPFDFTVLKAIYQFRRYLEPKGMMTSGRHFNHHLLDETAKLYDRNYVNFGNDWDTPKNLLCWQKVFGYVERFVPACDGQVIAQGPWSILENGDVSKRSLEFTYGGGSYFPLSSSPNWELGYNFAGCAGLARRLACRVPVHCRRVSKLMSSKNGSWACGFMPRPDGHQKSACVIL